GAGEPIRARPVGPVERAWRWCRREPALAALGAALVAGLIGVATQWWRAEWHLGQALSRDAALHKAKAALRKANTGEVEARERAQDRFQLGMEAVEGYSALVDDDVLKDPQLRGLRERGLGIALKFYTGLQESLEADLGPQSRGRLSEAYDRLGRLHA